MRAEGEGSTRTRSVAAAAAAEVVSEKEEEVDGGRWSGVIGGRGTWWWRLERGRRGEI